MGVVNKHADGDPYPQGFNWWYENSVKGKRGKLALTIGKFTLGLRFRTYLRPYLVGIYRST